MRYVVILGLIITALWFVMRDLVLSVYNIAVKALGTAVVAVVYFFQYYLWATPPGNVIVAALILLGTSLLLYRFFVAQAKRLETYSVFDQGRMKSVIQHVISTSASAQENASSLYWDIAPGRTKAIILRILVLVGLLGLLAAAFYLLTLSNFSPTIWGVLGLGLVLTGFFLVRFILVLPKSDPHIFSRQYEAPHE